MLPASWASYPFLLYEMGLWCFLKGFCPSWTCGLWWRTVRPRAEERAGDRYIPLPVSKERDSPADWPDGPWGFLFLRAMRMLPGTHREPNKRKTTWSIPFHGLRWFAAYMTGQVTVPGDRNPFPGDCPTALGKCCLINYRSFPFLRTLCCPRHRA